MRWASRAPQARKALKETGGDVNRALDWVFSLPDDQGDFGDDDGAQTTAAAAEPSAAIFQPAMAGSEELPAGFRLKSIVCHKGASIHAGYVSSISLFPSFPYPHPSYPFPLTLTPSSKKQPLRRLHPQTAPLDHHHHRRQSRRRMGPLQRRESRESGG